MLESVGGLEPFSAASSCLWSDRLWRQHGVASLEWQRVNQLLRGTTPNKRLQPSAADEIMSRRGW